MKTAVHFDGGDENFLALEKHNQRCCQRISGRLNAMIDEYTRHENNAHDKHKGNNEELLTYGGNGLFQPTFALKQITLPLFDIVAITQLLMS